jgi:hypothetical protein
MLIVVELEILQLPDDNDDVACEKLIKGLYKINKDFDVPSMKNLELMKKILRKS